VFPEPILVWLKPVILAWFRSGGNSHDITEILCEHFERCVGNDNCVSFEGKKLQIPADRHRMHYVKVKVRVHRYPDGNLAVFHGPRCLARYDAQGVGIGSKLLAAA